MGSTVIMPAGSSHPSRCTQQNALLLLSTLATADSQPVACCIPAGDPLHSTDVPETTIEHNVSVQQGLLQYASDQLEAVSRAASKAAALRTLPADVTTAETVLHLGQSLGVQLLLVTGGLLDELSKELKECATCCKLQGHPVDEDFLVQLQRLVAGEIGPSVRRSLVYFADDMERNGIVRAIAEPLAAFAGFRVEQSLIQATATIHKADMYN